MAFNFNLYHGVLILLTVVLIVVIALKCTVKSCNCKSEGFESYHNMDKYINHLKEYKDIGVPSGLLSSLPDQTTCTGSGKNLMVQDKVTFKPTRFKTGCTYIDMQYPG